MNEKKKNYSQVKIEYKEDRSLSKGEYINTSLSILTNIVSIPGIRYFADIDILIAISQGKKSSFHSSQSKNPVIKQQQLELEQYERLRHSYIITTPSL